MVTKDRIRQYFLDLPKSSENIIQFCQEVYEEKARQKGDLFVTNYLDLLVRQVCKTLGISNPKREKISKALFHLIVAYRVRSGMTPNKAPIFHPNHHLQVIEYLWFKNQPSTELTFASKTAAVQALICQYTFRRWIDPSRIRWEHCTIAKIANRIFYKFTLAASKSNVKGQRAEFITLQENGTKLCPVKILRQYWQIQGCPRTGFVLPCIHKDRVFKPDSLCQQWDAYVCNGHRIKGKGKVPCMGEIHGTTSFGFYKRAAEKLGWKTMPHSHSFRRAGIVIANKLKVPKERITEFFGWKSTSEMPSLYVMEELATTSQGLAWKFADALSDNLDCLNDISFAE